MTNRSQFPMHRRWWRTKSTVLDLCKNILQSLFEAAMRLLPSGLGLSNQNPPKLKSFQSVKFPLCVSVLTCTGWLVTQRLKWWIMRDADLIWFLHRTRKWILSPVAYIGNVLWRDISIWPIWTGGLITGSKTCFSVQMGMWVMFYNNLNHEPIL